MCYRYLLLLLFSFSLLISVGFAQTAEKKQMDHDVYAIWNRISKQQLSRDGSWVAYEQGPEKGDGALIVHSANGKTSYTIPRGKKAVFSSGSRWVAAHIKAPADSIRAAKVAELDKEEMPQDSLALLDLSNGKLTKFPRLKSFQFPKESDTYFSWLQHMEAPNDSTEHKGGHLLHLHNLSEQTAPRKINHIKAWFINPSGSHIAAVNNLPDTTRDELWISRTKNLQQRLIAAGKADFKHLTIDESGRYAAFISNFEYPDSMKPRPFKLYIKDIAKKEPIYDNANLTGEKLTRISDASEHKAPFFSENGKRLFFGFQAFKEIAEDDNLLDEEKVVVDIWHWKDPLIQPNQQKQLKQEKERSYLAYMRLKDMSVTPLETVNIPDVNLPGKGDEDFALGQSNLPYRQEISWDFPRYQDYFLLNIKNGTSKRLLEGIQSTAQLSPKGKFVVWWERNDSSWYSMQTASGKKTNLTKQLDATFHNPLHDWAFKASPANGNILFLDDESVLISERHDVWRFHLRDKGRAELVTGGSGKKNGIRYRTIDTTEEGETTSASAPVLVFAFHDKSRASGFAELLLKERRVNNLLVSDHRYRLRAKAKDANRYLISKESFQEFPDLHVADSGFKKVTRVSDANPQQKDYLWGSAEQMQYTSTDGRQIEGMLFKPENFDAGKRYPLMVYFYERNADRIHSHRAPYPHRSVINITFYTSRGYVVFVPDIHYTVGYPGESAMKCVMPGVEQLIASGYIDSDNIGVQGHSWGGYQIAYMVTRTNLFKAAAGGAPVSNMISAYGGVRWRTGMSRMFQYEHTQSRIGGTLWEKPFHYIDNSPIFRVPDIHTPLLILHNDHDGAVPWYQGIELFLAMRRLGKPAWMINYNDEPHWPVKYQNKVDWQTRLQQYFDHYLKGAPAPKWIKEGVPALQKGTTLGLETE